MGIASAIYLQFAAHFPRNLSIDECSSRVWINNSCLKIRSGHACPGAICSQAHTFAVAKRLGMTVSKSTNNTKQNDNMQFERVAKKTTNEQNERKKKPSTHATPSTNNAALTTTINSRSHIAPLYNTKKKKKKTESRLRLRDSHLLLVSEPLAATLPIYLCCGYITHCLYG